MDRRLPVYFLIDCSHSMRGAPLAMVQQGLEHMVQELRMNPQALETVWLSVITFSAGAKQVVALTEVLQFQPPQLIAKGRTDLGAGLRLLAKKADLEVRANSADQKGDWKPVVFLLSDGGPGDSWIKPAMEIRKRHEAGRMNVIAVGFGPNIHAEKLQRITPQVLIAKSATPESFAKFLSWASLSISRSCQVGKEDSDIFKALPPPPEFVICPP